jgi:predicted nucleotidyltransferase
VKRRAGLRRAIAEEAARLMVDENIREYVEAKRIAADNLLGMRVDAVPLPSNGEIRAAIVARAALTDGHRHRERLVHMRRVAVALMEELQAFEPRLIGSVATGNIHRNSDVDIQVFCSRHDVLEDALRQRGHRAERLEHEIWKDGAFHRYLHYHFEVEEVPVELSVYEPAELRIVRFSSIDGRPIDRVPLRRVAALLRG